MEKVEFEEVEGFDVPGALNGEEVELPVNRGEDSSDLVTEHIYVVFSENITIENGIKLIEDSVLSGEKLDVRRQDETGHAIVCVVNSAQRAAIEKLSEVTRVKVESAANPTKNGAAEKTAGDTSNNAATEGASESTADASEGEPQKSTLEDTTKKNEQVNTQEESSEETKQENTQNETSEKNTKEENQENSVTNSDTSVSAEESTSEMVEETESDETSASSVAVSSDEVTTKKNNISFTGITIATVIALVAVGIAAWLRKK